MYYGDYTYTYKVLVFIMGGVYGSCKNSIYMNDFTQLCACLFLRILSQDNTSIYDQTKHCENDILSSKFLVAGFFNIFGTCLKAASRSMIVIMEPSKYVADNGLTG